MLLDLLRADLTNAQKEHNDTTVSTLRFLLAQITNARIAKGAELSDDEIIDQIAKEVKRHKESVEAFQKGNRPELAQKEQAELAVLESYLPEQLSEDELQTIIADAITKTQASDIKDMGKVIGMVMPQVKGKADGSLVSRLVKEKLSS